MEKINVRRSRVIEKLSYLDLTLRTHVPCDLLAANKTVGDRTSRPEADLPPTRAPASSPSSDDPPSSLSPHPPARSVEGRSREDAHAVALHRAVRPTRTSPVLCRGSNGNGNGSACHAPPLSSCYTPVRVGVVRRHLHTWKHVNWLSSFSRQKI